MKLKTITIGLMTAFSAQVLAADVINHKSPYCGCCGEWSTHMEDAGYEVNEVLHDDMNAVKAKFGITQELSSCHTAEIDGYIFEGHIPAEDIKAFLANPPKNAKGLAVPGMPMARQVWSMVIRKMHTQFTPLMTNAKSSNLLAMKATKFFKRY